MRKTSVLAIVGLLLISCVPIISAQWTSDPTQNTPISTMSGDQALPKIAVDAAGNSYISWFSVEGGNYHVRLQRLDKNGNMLWPENGIVVSNQQQDTWITDYDLAVDPAGYAVITFSDIRTGSLNPVAYRVSPDGNETWGPLGVQLSSDANFNPSPKITVTPAGNTIVAWESDPNSGDEFVKVQKISPDGTCLWGDGIVIAVPGINCRFPYLEPADGDNVYLIWHQETGPFYSPNRGLYAEELDANGSFLWPTPTEVYPPIAQGPVVSLKMCRDDVGGIIFTWDIAFGLQDFKCFVQRIDANGNPGMQEPVMVSTSDARLHMYPVVTFLPETRHIVVFFSEQDLNQYMRGLYAQALDMNGTRLWTDDGKELIPLGTNDYSILEASSKDDQAISIYEETLSGSMSTHIQATMIDDQGNFVWPDNFVDLSTVDAAKLHMVISDYYWGQWVSVWEDGRASSGSDIYAQNVQLDGSLGPVQNQSPVADFTWTPTNPTPQDMVLFTDLSTDPLGNIVNWTWDFGDGHGSFDQNPGHQYPTAGTYTVSLNVTDNYGLSGTAEKQIVVSFPEDLNITIKSGVGLGVTVTFKNQGVMDANATWDLSVQGGILGHINKHLNGTIEIAAGDEVAAKTGILFGFGAITITAKLADLEQTAQGTQLIILTIVK